MRPKTKHLILASALFSTTMNSSVTLAQPRDLEVLALIVDFKKPGTEERMVAPCNTEFVNSVLFSGTSSVRNNYLQTSYGKLNIYGSVLYNPTDPQRLQGHYEIEADTQRGTACNLDEWARKARDAAGIDHYNYNRKIIYAFPYACDGFSQGMQPRDVGIVRCNKRDLYNHELGHVLALDDRSTGMHHAGTGKIYKGMPKLIRPYGDSEDFMGKGGFEKLPNSPHRYELGFIPESSAITVLSDGVYTVIPTETDPEKRWSYPDPDTTASILKIPVPNSTNPNDFLFVSYRLPYYVNPEFYFGRSKGVFIHSYNFYPDHLYPVVETIQLAKLNSAGKKFVIGNDKHKVTIELREVRSARGSESVKIAITAKKDLSQCVRRAPTVTATFPTPEDSFIDNRVQVQVDVTNNDENCPPSEFIVHPVSVPASLNLTDFDPFHVGRAQLLPSGKRERYIGLVTLPASPQTVQLSFVVSGSAASVHNVSGITATTAVTVPKPRILFALPVRNSTVSGSQVLLEIAANTVDWSNPDSFSAIRRPVPQLVELSVDDGPYIMVPDDSDPRMPAFMYRTMLNLVPLSAGPHRFRARTSIVYKGVTYTSSVYSWTLNVAK